MLVAYGEIHILRPLLAFERNTMATNPPKTLIRLVSFGVETLNLVAPKQAAKVAFNIFGKPRRGKIRPVDQSFLETAEHAFGFESPHGNIQGYIWQNDGPQTVLLLHGWESNSARWHQLIPKLCAQNFRVIAIDAPAHGKSDGKYFSAIKYAEVIHALTAVENFHYSISHSIGGMAMTYYLTHFSKDHADGHILMGAPATFERIFNEYFNLMGYSSSTRANIHDLVLQKFNKPTQYFQVANFQPNISVPALVIHDEEDQIVPFHESQDYLKTFSNAELLVTKGYGHRLKHAFVYDAILDFLANQPG